MADELLRELAKRVRPVPSHNSQPAQRIQANPHPVRDKINSVIESVRQQPFSRILDLVGMSPVTHAQQILHGEDPLQVLGPDLAGVPFSALTRGKPVYHGTPFRFNKFDFTRNDPKDSIGWMTHFSETPEYANDWASGAMKNRPGEVHFQSGGVSWDANRLSANPRGVFEHKPYTLDELIFRNDAQLPEANFGPQVIPAQIKAENILDTVRPNATDAAAVIGNMPPRERQAAIAKFKWSRRNDPVRFGSNTFGNTMGGSGYATDELRYTLARAMQNPETFYRTPFDAVRYTDGGVPSIAVPPSTPILSQWGAPLNNPVKPYPETIDDILYRLDIKR